MFAPVPAENAAAAIANWAPFVRGLERELGIKVEQVNPTDYAGVIEAQLSNKVDLAMYGPFSYYLATQAGAKIDPVAVVVSQIGTPATYQSYLVTKAGSTIASSTPPVLVLRGVIDCAWREFPLLVCGRHCS